jgi:hypothetical protein
MKICNCMRNVNKRINSWAPLTSKVELDVTKGESEKLLLQWAKDYLPACAKVHKISGA